MDVDDFLQEKKALEAKERLEEAKRKLKEEKERLREEQKKLRGSQRSERISEDDNSGKNPSDYRLKPWMLWDLIILFVALGLFIIAMIYPQTPTGAAVLDNPEIQDYIDQKVSEKVASLETEVENVKQDIEEKEVLQEKKEDVKNAVTTAAETNEDPVPLIDFTAIIVDQVGNIAAEIENNGSDEIVYELVIENLNKNDHMVCKTDRIKDGEETKDYASNIYVKMGEKDESLYRVTDAGTTNFVYKVRCAFAEYSYQQKLEPISGFSKDIEVKIKTVLN